jgi:hypothetical protein
MKYYLERSRLTQPKNRAQKHLQEFIEKFNRMLVNSDDDLERIVERIAAEVAGTNARYPRCSDIVLKKDAYASSDSVNIWLSAGIEDCFAGLHAGKVFREFDETLLS